MTGRHRTAALVVVGLSLVATLPTGVGATSDDIEQSFAAARADGDAVRMTVEYRLPDRVSELTVRLPVAGAANAEVVGLRGFSRANATTFTWTGVERPRIAVRVGADDDRVIAGEDWAFVVRPDVSVSYSYGGDQPGVTTTFAAAGEGYAAGPVAYLGPYRTASATADGERTVFVVAGSVEPVDLRNAREFLRLAPGRFDLGVRRDSTAAFVIPARDRSETGTRIAGAAVETSFWVEPDALAFRTTDTAFTHEYVHTRLGVLGSGSTRWLTEATAEYFGHAFALNSGAGDYEGFRGDLAADRYAPSRNPVTLSEPATWRGTLANYEKGALVLAALDAEIRERTDGRYALADVFVRRPGPYPDHAAFRRAVVGTTGVASLGPWLDRYVTTDALPPLPDDPAHFVYGPDLDPDGDGATSGTERRRGTNPFVADATTATARPDGTATPTSTATPTATPTATAAPDGTGTAAVGAGPGAPGAVAALGVAALAGALLARTRR
ncbi:MAG: hypothetical protein ABEJ34_05295 [Haloferacaceae archaeon]